ncbi:MAG: hypothetical protein LBO72_09260 [Helicobacteraceae bacterium]|jgi:hypothetical protein|nr:hypothetical protein [Helicobacteraceae bacterium]
MNNDLFRSVELFCATISRPECGFTAWHEQNEALWIAAVAKYGDPVELSDFEVEKIVAFLQKLLKENFR